MLDWVMAGGCAVFVFLYASIAVAVYKVRRASPRDSGVADCSDCRGGTKRGTHCWHYETAHEPARAARVERQWDIAARWFGAFWVFVGVGLAIARTSVLLARAASVGPSLTGQRIAHALTGRDERHRGLQDRIAELEAELGIDPLEDAKE